MLAVVPFTMLAYAKLLQVEAPASSVALSSAVGLSGVLAVYFLETDAQFGVFSMSMAIGFQLVLAALMVAMAPGRHGAQWRVVLNMIHGLSALAFFVRAGMALNGQAMLVSTGFDSPAQIVALCVAALYSPVATVVFIVMVSQRQRREMSDRLRRDGLTGLYTRTAFFEMAAAKPHQWQAGGYALVLMDIDNFKRINDSYGHAGGECRAGACRPHVVAVDPPLRHRRALRRRRIPRAPCARVLCRRSRPLCPAAGGRGRPAVGAPSRMAAMSASRSSVGYACAPDGQSAVALSRCESRDRLC